MRITVVIHHNGEREVIQLTEDDHEPVQTLTFNHAQACTLALHQCSPTRCTTRPKRARNDQPNGDTPSPGEATPAPCSTAISLQSSSLRCSR
ncbi:MAG: hypothetical protein ACRD0U_21570 [Acidimicrobiales bacterium]